MKTALLLLTLSLPAVAAENTFDRTLTTSPNPVLFVETNSGNVHLHPGSDNQIHIYAKMRSGHGWLGGSDSDVESRMQQIAKEPPIRQEGSTVKIGEHNNDGLYRNISIDYDITLPRAAILDAGSGSGDITVEDVGASLKAHTGSGNIHAKGIGGPANLDTGSGDIQLEQAASGNSDVRAQTGSGSIRLEGLSGGLDTHTGSGDITVSGSPAADWRLQTSSGSLRLNLGPKAHFTLDANTGSASVHTEQPISIQGALDKHHVRGAVNGGGPTLRAGTGSGDIDIR